MNVHKHGTGGVLYHVIDFIVRSENCTEHGQLEAIRAGYYAGTGVLYEDVNTRDTMCVEYSTRRTWGLLKESEAVQVLIGADKKKRMDQSKCCCTGQSAVVGTCAYGSGKK